MIIICVISLGRCYSVSAQCPEHSGGVGSLLTGDGAWLSSTLAPRSSGAQDVEWREWRVVRETGLRLPAPDGG